MLLYSYIALTVVAIILLLFNFFSLFSVPARPIEYYVYDLDSVLFYMEISNIAIKIVYSIVFWFYIRLLDIFNIRAKERMTLGSTRMSMVDQINFGKNSISEVLNRYYDGSNSSGNNIIHVGKKVNEIPLQQNTSLEDDFDLLEDQRSPNGGNYETPVDNLLKKSI